MPTEPDVPPGPAATRAEPERRRNLMAGLIVTAPVGSLVVGVITGGVFILGVDGIRAIVTGLLLGAACWFVMGLAATSFLGVDRANRSIHKELMTRMEAMSAGSMPESAAIQLHALAQEMGVSLSSMQSDDERRRLINQLQNPPR